MDQQVWMITGASQGMGLETALAALDAGHRVAATSRSAQRLQETVAQARPQALDRFLGLSMAFEEESIARAVAEVQERWGRLDVLVNNAGYAVLGALEEFSMEEVRTNFDVNVFGLLAVTQAVLPFMREQGSGRIINLASVSGTVTGPAQGIYSATKAAVIMMTEALAAEVAPLGLHATAVCPGGVRTDFLDASSMRRPQRHLPEYDAVVHAMQGLGELNHHQKGDPALVGRAMVELAGMEQPPARLYLGEGALHAVRHQAHAVLDSATEHEALSRSIDD